MSVRVMTAVWQHSKAKGSALLMLLAIADMADDAGDNAYPLVSTLAQKSRLSKRSVQYIVRDLEDLGEVQIVINGGPIIRGTNKRSNMFRVTVEGVQSLHPQTQIGVQPIAPSGVKPVSPEGCNPLHPDPSVDPSFRSMDPPDPLEKGEQKNGSVSIRAVFPDSRGQWHGRRDRGATDCKCGHGCATNAELRQHLAEAKDAHGWLRVVPPPDTRTTVGPPSALLRALSGYARGDTQNHTSILGGSLESLDDNEPDPDAALAIRRTAREMFA